MPGLAATVKTLARSRAVWTLADQAVVSGGNFLTQLLLLRTFVREDYGLFAVGFTIVQFLLNNQAALVTTAYMVFYPKTAAEDRAAYAGSTLIHQAVLAVCGAAALCLGAIGVYLSGARPGLGVVLACQAAAILFLLFRDYARQISFAGLRVHDALAVDSVFVGVQFAGAALLAWQGQLSPGRMFLVMGAAALVAALVWRAMSRQQFSPIPPAPAPTGRATGASPAGSSPPASPFSRATWPIRGSCSTSTAPPPTACCRPACWWAFS